MDALVAAYGVDRLWLGFAALSVPGAVLLLGPLVWRLPRRVARAAAWGLVVASVAGVERLTAGAAPGFRMLAVIAALFPPMKLVVAIESRDKHPLSFGRWLLWAGAWPGMRPDLFSRWRGGARSGAAGLVLRGVAMLGLGLALIAAARALRLATEAGPQATVGYVGATGLLLVGVSLALHFGVFGLVAGGWRALGVDTYPLFQAPLVSRTLSEFWGRRWNLPFTEMIQRGLYRPLSGAIGRDGAALAGFVFSGLLHELAISVPVLAGFGLPAAYFALHGALMLVERRWDGLRQRLESTALGHLWTIGWLALPMPILFHAPFLRGCIWPLAGFG